jgi:hypothetical protein
MNTGTPFRRFLLRLCRVFAALLLFTFTLGVIMHVDPVKRQQKRKIQNKVPDTFPVLILVPVLKEGHYEAKIIPYRDLPSYQQELKGLIFLVPQNLGKELNTQLRVFCEEQGKLHREDRAKEDCFSAGFAIEKQTSERQSLKVWYMWDDDRPNTGWYEATEKEIFPMYRETFFWPGLLMIEFFVTLLLTFILWKVLKRGYRAWKSKTLFDRADSRTSLTP